MTIHAPDSWRGIQSATWIRAGADPLLPRGTPTTWAAASFPGFPRFPSPGQLPSAASLALLWRISGLRRTSRVRTAAHGRSTRGRRRSEILVVQHRRGRFSNRFQLVLQQLLLQSLNDRVLDFAQRDLPDRYSLVNKRSRRVTIGLRNLACFQLKYPFVIYGQTARALCSQIDLGRRSSGDAGCFEDRLLQL